MFEACTTLLEVSLTAENILWCAQFAVELNNAELKHTLKLDTLACDVWLITNSEQIVESNALESELS